MSFDPDRHSLSKALVFLPHGWQDQHDRAVKTLVEEFGFSLDESMHLDDLLELADADRSGQRRTWSSWKSHDDLEAAAAAYYEEELLEATATGEKGPPYRVIYADPGWQYRNRRTGGSMKSGAAQQYTVTSEGYYAQLPVKSLVHPDGAALFLWGTVPMLPECWSVFSAWGATYKTSLFWVKDAIDPFTEEISNGRLGLGYWFRGQVEYCLVGTFGNVRAFRCQKRNYIFAKSTSHSKKPVEARRLILEATQALGGPRVELFSRDLTRGWDHWGDEVRTDLEIVDGHFRRLERRPSHGG